MALPWEAKDDDAAAIDDYSNDESEGLSFEHKSNIHRAKRERRNERDDTWTLMKILILLASIEGGSVA